MEARRRDKRSRKAVTTLWIAAILAAAITTACADNARPSGTENETITATANNDVRAEMARLEELKISGTQHTTEPRAANNTGTGEAEPYQMVPLPRGAVRTETPPSMTTADAAQSDGRTHQNKPGAKQVTTDETPAGAPLKANGREGQKGNGRTDATTHSADPRRLGRNWFMRSLTEHDRACFPPTVAEDRDALGYLRWADKSGDGELRACLTDEAQIAAQIVQKGREAGTYEEEACIWKGARVETGRAKAEDPLGWNRILTAEIQKERDDEELARRAVKAFCSNATDDTSRILTCLVGSIGGPDRFVAANLERNTVRKELEAALDGAGPCGDGR